MRDVAKIFTSGQGVDRTLEPHLATGMLDLPVIFP